MSRAKRGGSSRQRPQTVASTAASISSQVSQRPPSGGGKAAQQGSQTPPRKKVFTASFSQARQRDGRTKSARARANERAARDIVSSVCVNTEAAGFYVNFVVGGARGLSVPLPWFRSGILPGGRAELRAGLVRRHQGDERQLGTLRDRRAGPAAVDSSRAQGTN